ncbi:MAG: DUF2243 domain-containing protein [Actinomycetota bacterium]
MRREAGDRLGSDPRLILTAVLFGIGAGGWLHRALVATLDGWDRLSPAPQATRYDTMNDVLTIGPWVAVGLSAAIFAMSRGRGPAWNRRRAIGIALAAAGGVVLVVGELEVHAFDTLQQGWRPHDLFWDVVFHLPGEAIAFAGWLLLPAGSRQTSSGTRPSVSAGAER